MLINNIEGIMEGLASGVISTVSSAIISVFLIVCKDYIGCFILLISALIWFGLLKEDVEFISGANLGVIFGYIIASLIAFRIDALMGFEAVLPLLLACAIEMQKMHNYYW